MRAVLVLMLAGCGFKGASLGSDAAPIGNDVAPSAIDAPVLVDAAPVIVDGAPPIDAAADAMLDAAPKACPTGGQKLGSNLFYFSATGQDKHWWEAEAACEAMGTAGTLPVHLATPANQGEAQMIGQAMSPTPYAWLGVFQSLGVHGKADDWFAITGGAAYTNWANNEPSDGGGSAETGRENFAQLYPDGTMNDTAGTDNLHYICECDGKAADPTAKLLVPPEPPN